MRSSVYVLKAVVCVLVCIFVLSTVASAAPASAQLLQRLRKDPDAMNVARVIILRQAADEGRILRETDLTDDNILQMIAANPDLAMTVAKALSARQNASAVTSTPPSENDVITTSAAALGAAPNLGSGQQSLTASPVLGAVAPSMIAAQPARVLQEGATTTPDASQSDGSFVPTTTGESISSSKASPDHNATPNVIPSPNPILTPVQHPYARVRALDDLYQQVTTPNAPLERFGTSIFRNGTGNTDVLPMDLPAGPDYVIGPGDGLKVELWGGISQRLQSTVDREGRIALPEVGLLQVAGRNLADAQHAIETVLRGQFKQIQAEVSLTRIRSVRVYVVGDVERPGAYDISSLSSPLNALFAAGGPTERGSLRTLKHYRGKQLVQELDTYELFLYGVRSGVDRLESGDTILVPPIGPEVTLEGMVRRPAIYELHGETDLSKVLELAGGVLPLGTKRHVDVERVEAHEKRTMLSLDLPENATELELTAKLQVFAIQDGDDIHISPVLSYTEKSVYLDGHVFNPAKRAWHEGMTVLELIHSYADLLPEPYRGHAEIVRLVAPDFRPQVIGFNLDEVLDHKTAPPVLQPFDTVRIFSRFDFEDLPDITISGEVRSPGSHRTNGETRIADAIYLAGGVTPDALLDYAHVFRQIEDGRVLVLSADLRKALAGDAKENILLVPRDQVVVHCNMAKLDPAVVYIAGSVMAPGKYPLGEGMRAADLVRVAGGLRRGAYTLTADLARVAVENGQTGITSETRQIKIGEALNKNANEDIVLRDGDVLSIRQIAGWDDIGASITIRGQVAHPGTYGITAGEKLSSVIKRAGGFYRGAYPAGAMLTRVEVKDLAEKSRADLIERLEEAITEPPQVSPGANAQEQLAVIKAIQAQQQQMIATLKRQQADGRLVVRIADDISKWENTADDIEVRDGDVLSIPKRPTFVLVNGQVYNRSAITWVPGKKAGWYLQNAGGPTESANKKAIFIIRANGSIIGQGSNRDALAVKLQPGDSIVVPEKILSTSSRWKSLLSAAQVMSAFSLTAAAISGL